MPTRNVQKEIKEVLIAVALKTGQPYDLIEDVYNHEFEFTSKQITMGERGYPETYENILLKHFGSFLSNAKYISKLKEIQDEKYRDKGEEDTTNV